MYSTTVKKCTVGRRLKLKNENISIRYEYFSSMDSVRRSVEIFVVVDSLTTWERNCIVYLCTYTYM